MVKQPLQVYKYYFYNLKLDETKQMKIFNRKSFNFNCLMCDDFLTRVLFLGSGVWNLINWALEDNVIIYFYWGISCLYVL